MLIQGFVIEDFLDHMISENTGILFQNIRISESSVSSKSCVYKPRVPSVKCRFTGAQSAFELRD
jgi:hypothetical protein